MVDWRQKTAEKYLDLDEALATPPEHLLKVPLWKTIDLCRSVARNELEGYDLAAGLPCRSMDPP